MPTETGSRQAIRNALTTLPHLPHTCFDLIQIKATLIYFQFRAAAPATNKNNSQCNSIKGFPKHTQSMMSKYCQKVYFNWARKLQKFHCNCCCCCYCWYCPPAAHFVVAAFRFDSNMTSANNTDSPSRLVSLWRHKGTHCWAGSAPAPAPASTPALCLSKAIHLCHRIMPPSGVQW